MGASADFLWRCGAVTALVLAHGGCTEPDPPPTMPTGPDLSGLVSAYDAPTGTLTEAELATVPDRYRELRDRIEALGLTDELEGSVRELVDEAASKARELGLAAVHAPPVPAPPATAPARRTASTDVDLYARVTRTCPGLLEPPVAAAENGSLVLHAGIIGTDQLAPNVWIDVNACRYPVNGTALQLDGGERAVRVWLGSEVQLTELRSVALLFDVQVTVARDGAAPEPVRLDFRVALDGTLETRVPLMDGEVIVGAGIDGNFTVHDARGVTTCSAALVCTGPDGKAWP